MGEVCGELKLQHCLIRSSNPTRAGPKSRHWSYISHCTSRIRKCSEPQLWNCSVSCLDENWKVIWKPAKYCIVEYKRKSRREEIYFPQGRQATQRKKKGKVRVEHINCMYLWNSLFLMASLKTLVRQLTTVC